MPGVDGIEATRQIVSADPQCRVLILTTFAFTRSAYGRSAGVVAAALVAFVPDVLAHSGISYNDVPLADGTAALYSAGQADFVFDMNPGHVLLAGTQRAADKHLERRNHSGAEYAQIVVLGAEFDDSAHG